jgi:glycosyltransferase involved in cell wall biosynthesis
LLQQTVRAWKAIIVFDGCSPTDKELIALLVDDRFLCLRIQKTGIVNYAGFVRNIGLSQVTTPWVGFVDDDDMITANYIERLQEEIAYTPSADVILFRMAYLGRVIPALQHYSITCCDVGISFAYKRELIDEDFVFQPSNIEDYQLLKMMETKGKCIVISPYVTYLVRHEPYIEGDTTRAVIHIKS